MKNRPITSLEQRTARLTILVDPRKKAVFERLCDAQDLTPSQVLRQLIRGYIEQRTGHPWIAQAPVAGTRARSAAAGRSRAASGPGGSRRRRG